MWHGVTSLHISTWSSDRNTLSLLEPAARCSWMAAKQMVLSSAPRWPPSVKTRSESFMFISGSSACFHHDAAQREGWTWREGGRKHLLDDGNITDLNVFELILCFTGTVHVAFLPVLPSFSLNSFVFFFYLIPSLFPFTSSPLSLQFLLFIHF